MATVKVYLGLNSNNVLSSPLALSVSSSIIADSGSLIKAKVKGTAVDTNDMIVYLANEKSERAYLYVRNLETRLEDYLFLRNETESDTAFAAKIGGGEFAFIPLSPDKTYAVHGTKPDSLIEYGVFGLDNSSVVFGCSGT